MFSIEYLTLSLAASSHRDQYFLMNMEEVNSCTQIEDESFLCSRIQTKKIYTIIYDLPQDSSSEKIVQPCRNFILFLYDCTVNFYEHSKLSFNSDVYFIPHKQLLKLRN